MPSKRTLLGAAAFSVALAGGGVAGAVLGTPSVSSAQDTTTSTTAKDGSTGTKAADANRPDRPHPRLGVLKEAADALGMEPADLLAELKAGKSIADVAKEKGVSEQKVIDAIVSAGTERLQKAIDELPDHAKEAVEREGLPQRPDRPGHDGGPRPDDAPPADSDS